MKKLLRIKPAFAISIAVWILMLLSPVLAFAQNPDDFFSFEAEHHLLDSLYEIDPDISQEEIENFLYTYYQQQVEAYYQAYRKRINAKKRTQDSVDKLSQDQLITQNDALHTLAVPLTNNTVSEGQVPDAVEYAALEALYNATGGDNWRRNNNWLQGNTNVDFATWYGIEVENGDVISITLYFNKLTGAIPPELGDLSNLQQLYFFNNPINSLPSEIGNLDNLQTLGLTGSKLTSLPAEIGNLQNLQELSLSFNPINRLPSGIGNLDNLHTLRLLSNKLTSLPAEIGNLDNLQTLELRSNQLTSLPAEIGNLQNLQELSLPFNQINRLPSEIGNLGNLQTLELLSNKLISLPAEIGNLQNLQELSLSSNQINSLPSEIGNLDNLQTLRLTGNNLISLPTEIGNLQNLQKLSLASNQLTSLPAEIGNLFNLQGLFLGNNKLTLIPSEIGNLQNLQKLSIRNDQLTDLPSEIGKLINLQNLTVTSNQLTSLPAEIAQLSNLQVLILNNNQLSSIPETIFSLANLKSLNLNGNQLSGLPDFTNHPKVSEWYLRVDNNRINLNDIAHNLSGIETHNFDVFRYSPQESITGEAKTYTASLGEPVTLQAFYNNHPYTRFQWQKLEQDTWVDIAGATPEAYTFTAATLSEQYRCQITNSWVGDLIQYSEPQQVIVNNALLAPTGLRLEVLDNQSVRLSWEDNNTLETGYELGLSAPNIRTANPFHTTEPNATSYTFTGLNENVFTFSVRATYKGNIDSENSRIVLNLDRTVRRPPVIRSGSMVVSMLETFRLPLQASGQVPMRASPLKIAVLGSSTAAGVGASGNQDWVSLLKNQYSQATVTNLAAAGQTTRDLLPSGDPNHNLTQALSYDPSLIIVNLGSDDVAQFISISEEETMANLIALRQAAEAAGVAVLFTTTQPRNLNSDDQRRALSNLSGQIYNRFESVDIFREFVDSDNRLKTQYSSDGIHLNNAGHRYVFSQLQLMLDRWVAENDITLTVTGLPDFASFNPAQRILTGTPSSTHTATDEGRHDNITIRATNAAGLSSEQTISLLVTPWSPVSSESILFKPRYNGNVAAMVWNTFHYDSPTAQQVYTYEYDQANRLQEARYASRNGDGSWTAFKDYYSVKDIRYDANGNLEKLTRYSGEPRRKIMDDLTYTYKGNQLLAVDDAGDNAAGFAENAVGTAYTYDANGNLIKDNHKRIEDIRYDLILNVPLEVTFQDGSRIRYLYDASGIRLRQEVISASGTVETTDYGAGVQYQNGTLDFIHHAEGRVDRREGGDFVYEYDLKDHLGNTRLTLAAENQVSTSTAGMETGGEIALLEEAVFQHIAETRQTLAYHNTTAATASEPQPNKVATLNAARGQSQGPAKSLRVRQGDTVQLSVKVRYEAMHKAQPPGLEGVASTIVRALGGTATGLEAQSVATPMSEALAGTALLTEEEDGVPKAYLNYLVFDEDYQLVDQGFQQVSQVAEVSQAHPDTEPEVLSLQVVAPENGYVQTYLSNESQADINVYFDDLQVVHRGSNILSVTDYYPFGAPFQQPSVGLNGKYLYQGKEWQSELGLNLYDFHARQYDPYLGRWHVQDPQQQFASPYLAMGNNPVSVVDPDGELAWFVPIIIGAVIGGTTGGIHASNDPNMSVGAGILQGALMGAVAGGAGAGVSALGGGAMLAGAASGAVGGAGFSGLSTGWNGSAMARGAFIGAASGFVGGGVASAIGGGAGALAGGVASDVTGQLLSTGNINPLQAGIAGAASFGMYHAMSYGSYKFGGGNTEIAGRKLSYRQFSKINTAYQKSRFWKKEHGVYLNNDGSARFVPRNDRHKFHVTFDDWQSGDFGTFHSHWAKPGSEWANIGGTGKWRRYNSSYNYPAGSYKVTAVGNSFSPGDISGLRGTSYVSGRTGSHYMLGGNSTIGQFSPDPFLRFFLFPW